jgi:hypothetical protein
MVCFVNYADMLVVRTHVRIFSRFAHVLPIVAGCLVMFNSSVKSLVTEINRKSHYEDIL